MRKAGHAAELLRSINAYQGCVYTRLAIQPMALIFVRTPLPDGFPAGGLPGTAVASVAIVPANQDLDDDRFRGRDAWLGGLCQAGRTVGRVVGEPACIGSQGVDSRACRLRLGARHVAPSFASVPRNPLLGAAWARSLRLPALRPGSSGADIGSLRRPCCARR